MVKGQASEPTLNIAAFCDLCFLHSGFLGRSFRGGEVR
jgi:hypothetical protein